MDYKQKIANLLASQVEYDIEGLKKLIEIPPKAEMGDFAFPCFALSKILRKAPNKIAEELKTNLNNEGFEKIENLGPYINFFVDKKSFSNRLRTYCYWTSV